ncbi:MAG: nucleotidyltransferase family protein [Leptospiraceae bacterium]|nr:nucleotidyltransferase family protein [Leptospiraceae bacterium]
MNAILLAAGLGTRLKPITDSIPKCLIPIHGKPLLEIWLEKLENVGVQNYLINTHHLSDQVESYIKKSRYSDRVTLSYESELLGTAGTLLANLDFFKGADGIFMHADNFMSASLAPLLLAHRQRPTRCTVTMLTFPSEVPSECGIVELDAEGVVYGFHEKVATPPGNLANGAIYVLSAEFLHDLPQFFSSAKDFSRDILPHLVNKIYSYETSGTFMDIGTHRALRLLRGSESLS